MQKASSFYLNFFIVILFVISAFVMFHIYSKIQENKTATNWEKTFGPIEDLPNQYPYRDDNEAAVQLKILAARVGINMAVNGDDDRRYWPSASDAKRSMEWQSKDWKFARYWRKWQGRRVGETVEHATPFLNAYLADYQKQLEVVRDHILTAPPILWRQDLKWTIDQFGANPALPSITGILELQSILRVRASKLIARKSYEEAEKYLAAGWKLNESLKSRCELSSQSYALLIDKWLMRLMPELPLGMDWIRKIGKHNYEKAYVKGFQVEAWFLWRNRNEGKMTKTPFLNNFLDPYVHLGVSSLLENEMKDIQRIASLDPCSLGYKDFKEFQTYESPEWNRIRTRGDLLDKNTTYAETAELKIIGEFNAKIIQARHGHFPKDGSERSEVCKDVMWDYWREPDGSITIKYRGNLELPNSTPAQKFQASFTVKPF